MQSAQPARKVSALGIGLLFGVILGVMLILLNLAGTFVKGLGLVTLILGFIIALVGYFFAGFRASAQTGKMSTGLLAGMWTGIFSSILSAIGNVVSAIPTLPEATAVANKAIVNTGTQTTFRYTETILLLAITAVFILFAIVSSAIALGVGAIGGAAGRSRAPMAQQVYQESMYQSPMGGNPPPQQPMQGGDEYHPQPGQYPPDAGGYPPQR